MAIIMSGILQALSLDRLLALLAGRRVTRGTDALAVWTARQRSRAALARLDAHMLRDIGLSAEMAETEAQKPFWRG